MKNMALSVTLAFASLFSMSVMAHEGHHGAGDELVAHLSYSIGLHAHIYWEVEPRVGTPAVMRIEFKSAADHGPADLKAQPNVDLWMPSMGHGSAPTIIQPVGDGHGGYLKGIYRVTNMHFIMGGDWDVRLTLIDANNVAETQSFSLVLPEDGHGGHHH